MACPRWRLYETRDFFIILSLEGYRGDVAQVAEAGYFHRAIIHRRRRHRRHRLQNPSSVSFHWVLHLLRLLPAIATNVEHRSTTCIYMI